MFSTRNVFCRPPTSRIYGQLVLPRDRWGQWRFPHVYRTIHTVDGQKESHGIAVTMYPPSTVKIQTRVSTVDGIVPFTPLGTEKYGGVRKKGEGRMGGFWRHIGGARLAGWLSTQFSELRKQKEGHGEHHGTVRHVWGDRCEQLLSRIRLRWTLDIQ